MGLTDEFDLNKVEKEEINSDNYEEIIDPSGSLERIETAYKLFAGQEGSSHELYESAVDLVDSINASKDVLYDFCEEMDLEKEDGFFLPL